MPASKEPEVACLISTESVPKCKLGDRTPFSVRQVLYDLGFIEVEDPDDEVKWQLMWKTGHFKVSEWSKRQPYQRINHLPKTSQITKKDHLVRNHRVMLTTFGSLFDFVPLAWLLPTEYVKWAHKFAEEKEEDPATMYIAKPSDLSRGRKIFIVSDIEDLVYDQSFVLQKYISNPLILDGYKFDLRIYVLLLSVSPLCLLVYHEGLARFATQKYHGADCSNLYAHLTNASINKLSPAVQGSPASVCPPQSRKGMNSPKRSGEFNECDDSIEEKVETGDSDASGSYSDDDFENDDCNEEDNPQLDSSSCDDGGNAAQGMKYKWLLSEVFDRFKKTGVDDRKLWARIKKLIGLTCAMLVGKTPEAPAGFELFGFDVLLDSNMKPWLIEVNNSPALGLDTDVDKIVKIPLLKDAFTFVTEHTRTCVAGDIAGSSAAHQAGDKQRRSPSPSLQGTSSKSRSTRSPSPSGNKSRVQLGAKTANPSSALEKRRLQVLSKKLAKFVERVPNLCDGRFELLYPSNQAQCNTAVTSDLRSIVLEMRGGPSESTAAVSKSKIGGKSGLPPRSAGGGRISSRVGIATKT